MSMDSTPAPMPSDQLRRLGRRLADPGKSSVFDMLAMLVDARDELAAYEAACVGTGRRAGASWAEVGAITGMARQNAQRKYIDAGAFEERFVNALGASVGLRKQ